MLLDASLMCEGVRTHQGKDDRIRLLPPGSDTINVDDLGTIRSRESASTFEMV